MLDEVAKGANWRNCQAVMNILAKFGTEHHTEHKLLSIDGDTVSFENLQTGETVKQHADYVVLSLGGRPDPIVKGFRADVSDYDACKKNVEAICKGSGGTLFSPKPIVYTETPICVYNDVIL